jgi:hypothetical protein
MEKNLPAGLVFVSLLLALYGVLSLIGCLYPPRDAESLFGACLCGFEYGGEGGIRTHGRG